MRLHYAGITYRYQPHFSPRVWPLLSRGVTHYWSPFTGYRAIDMLISLVMMAGRSTGRLSEAKFSGGRRSMAYAARHFLDKISRLMIHARALPKPARQPTLPPCHDFRIFATPARVILLTRASPHLRCDDIIDTSHFAVMQISAVSGVIYIYSHFTQQLLFQPDYTSRLASALALLSKRRLLAALISLALYGANTHICLHTGVISQDAGI